MEVSFCREQIGCELDVKGYTLLIKAYIMPDRTTGGIIRPDSVIDDQKRRQNLGLVLKIGPTAFVDRFEDRRCNVGDWVHYSTMEREPIYPGTDTCYYINDEKIYAVIPPEDLHVFANSMR